jgi:hypothetical protein
LAGLRAINPDQTEASDMPNDNFRSNSATVRRQAGELPLY